MPAIHLFGKRTLLGGDDLHVPALATVTVRLIQLSLLILPLFVYLWKQAIYTDSQDEDSQTTKGYDWPMWNYLFDWWNAMNINHEVDDNELPACTKSWFSRYYPFLSALHLVFSTLFCFHSLFLEYRIWHWSCQGTPTMRQPRTMKVQELLERKLGICTILLAILLSTTYFLAAAGFARPYHRCYIHTYLYESMGNTDDEIQDDAIENETSIDVWVGSPTWYLVGALLAVSQGIEVIVAALFYARLMSGTTAMQNSESLTEWNETSHTLSRTTSSSSLHHLVHHELTEELWADRCQSLFRCLSISTCFLFGGRDLMDNAQRNNSYRHVAQALADYLETKGTLDVVPTDLFTGLFILQRIQRQRILETRRLVYEESSSMLISASRIGNRSRGVRLETTRSSLPAYPEICDMATNDYHPLRSPDISQTGLRSRVASTNDLGGRTSNHSSRSPSPNSTGSPPLLTPMKNTTVSQSPSSLPQILDPPRTTKFSGMVSPLRNVMDSQSFISSPPSGSSSPLTGTQPQNQERQRKIYRRRYNSSSALIATASEDTTLDVSQESTDNRSFYDTTSRQILDPNNPVDASTLEEGARMCDYALSIYTWMLYVFVHPVTGLPNLMCSCVSKDRSMTTHCQSCCCTICTIMRDRGRSRAESPTSASVPLHRRRGASGTYNTNQHNLSSLSTQRTSLGSPPPSQVLPNVSNQSDDDSVFYDSNEFDHDYRYRTAGDNLCEWHKRALLLVAGLPDSDLVYAQFNNKLSSVPYCILLDHERSLVVLAIRGSLSLEDIVTDTLVLPESLESLGYRYGFDGRGQYCHAGVLACFENVLRDLHRHGWLEKLLDRDYPTYSLRIVGHSLGAGVCTLLGYVLRSKYPSLKVFGFSPPGCTMTWEMAKKCDEWCTSFVLDSDIVPRLSVLALEDLRDEVLELIGRIKVPKYKVFQNFLKIREEGGGCTERRERGTSDEYDNPNFQDDLDELTKIINDTLHDAPPDTIFQQQLRDFLQVQSERKEARGNTNSRSLRLYPPGKMIHLLKTAEEGGCTHLVNKCLTCCTSNSGFLYTPVYISNDDLNEIVVNATMGTDHFIDRMCDELHKISDEYLQKQETVIVRGNCGICNEIV